MIDGSILCTLEPVPRTIKSVREERKHHCTWPVQLTINLDWREGEEGRERERAGEREIEGRL